MLDDFGRPITYLRVSVTDRCNLRCRYCMPAAGVTPLKHNDILSYEEIIDFVQVAAGEGINKVRITGGEPLVRLNIIHLVKRLSGIAGIADLSMTTNAILLSDMAKPLREAGLMRINISLDTLNPERYHHITRGGDLQEALAGIKAADAAGFRPLKINCVVKSSRDEDDARAVAGFCKQHGFGLRYISEMDIAAGTFHVVEGGGGGDCARCNRLRLSADGFLRPCLFNDYRLSIRELGYLEAIRKAVSIKPESGTSSSNQMHCIGG